MGKGNKEENNVVDFENVAKKENWIKKTVKKVWNGLKSEKAIRIYKISGACLLGGVLVGTAVVAGNKILNDTECDLELGDATDVPIEAETF